MVIIYPLNDLNFHETKTLSISNKFKIDKTPSKIHRNLKILFYQYYFPNSKEKFSFMIEFV